MLRLPHSLADVVSRQAPKQSTEVTGTLSIHEGKHRQDRSLPPESKAIPEVAANNFDGIRRSQPCPNGQQIKYAEANASHRVVS